MTLEINTDVVDKLKNDCRDKLKSLKIKARRNLIVETELGVAFDVYVLDKRGREVPSVIPYNKVLARGDGACLFRSLSISYTGNEDNWMLVKAVCISEIVLNYNMYKEHVNVDGEDLETPILYWNYMVNNSTWGSFAEIHAFSKSMLLKVTIVSKQCEYIVGGEFETGIHLYYENNLHYDSLIPKAGEGLTIIDESIDLHRKDYPVLMFPIHDNTIRRRGFGRTFYENRPLLDTLNDEFMNMRPFEVRKFLFNGVIYIAFRAKANPFDNVNFNRLKSTILNSCVDKEDVACPLFHSTTSDMNVEDIITATLSIGCTNVTIYLNEISRRKFNNMKDYAVIRTDNPSNLRINKTIDNNEIVDFGMVKESFTSLEANHMPSLLNPVADYKKPEDKPTDADESKVINIVTATSKQFPEIENLPLVESYFADQHYKLELFFLFDLLIDIEKELDTIGGDECARKLNQARKMVHDILGREYCFSTGLDYTDDQHLVGTLTKLQNDRLVDGALTEWVNNGVILNLTNSPYRNLTPDNIVFYKNGELLRKDDGVTIADLRELKIEIIDYTCTVDPPVAYGSKISKYDPISSCLPEGVGFEVKTIWYHKRNHIVGVNSVGEIEGYNATKQIATANCYYDEVMIRARRKFHSDLNFAKTIDMDKRLNPELWEKPVVGEMSQEEFDNTTGKLGIYNKFLNEMDNAERHAFLAAINHYDDSPKNVEDAKIFNDLNEFVKSCCQDVYKECIKTKDNDSPFVKPDSEKIKVAVLASQDEASQRFERLIVPKNSMHFPCTSRKFTYKNDELLSMQVKTLSQFSTCASYARGRNTGDEILDGINTLLPFDHIPASYMEGIIKSECDMHLINNELTTISPEGEKIESVPLVVHEALTINDVKIKRHCTIKPVAKERNYNKLMQSVGVGKSKDKKEDFLRSRFEERVKSIAYWDPVENAKFTKVFNEESKLLIESLEDKGSTIENIEKEFEDDRSNILQAGAMEYLEDHDTFYSNLTHVSSFGCNGHRFVFCSNPNIMGITFPSESIMKSHVSRSYIILHLDTTGKSTGFGQHYKSYQTPLGTLHISMGKSETSKTLSVKTCSKPKFSGMVSCIKSLVDKDSNSTIDYLSFKDLVVSSLLSSVSSSIGNTSFFDNLRYIANNVQAEYSAAPSYVAEKLVIPCKNLFQLFLYNSTIRFCMIANKKSESIRISRPEFGDEGELMPETLRVSEGEMPSFFMPRISYKSPDSPISEIYTGFFAGGKGLHDPVHNSIKIHKTPLEIQRDLNIQRCLKFGLPQSEQNVACYDDQPENPLDCFGNFKECGRTQFSYKTIVASAAGYQDALDKSSSSLRYEMLYHSGVNDNPLTIKTMSSTRATISKHERIFDLSSKEKLRQVQQIFQLNEKESEIAFTYLNDLFKIVSSSDKLITKRNAIRKLKSGLKKLNGPLGNKLSSIRISYKNKTISLPESENLNIQGVFTFPDDKHTHKSTTVLSETIRILKEKPNEEHTIGTLAKQFVMDGQQMTFSIRPKGQRTQDDREIYLADIETKMRLYNIEHPFSIVNRSNKFERISEGGDKKIMTIAKQVREGLTWLQKKEEEERSENFGVINSENKNITLHGNFDCSKWSPKDNLLKYVIFVAFMKFMKPGEKRFLISILFQLYGKKLQIDNRLLENANKGTQKLTNEGVDYTCIFKEMTKNFSTTYARIAANWFQGQLNHLSSALFSGLAKILETLILEFFKGAAIIHCNIHSDDSQFSIYHRGDKSPKELKNFLTNCLIRLTRLSSLEISIKKSYISSVVKEFISQINVGGQQKMFWVKSVMSMISGTPLTNLEEDHFSCMSKASEALLKGASQDVALKVMNETCKNINEIYGINDYKGNKFSRAFNIEENETPTCLGGYTVRNLTEVAMAGPRSRDLRILTDIFTKCGGTWESRPKRLPDNYNDLVVVKIYYVLYKLYELSNEFAFEDEETSKLNAFKSSSFKTRDTNTRDPFNEEDKEQRKLKAEEFRRDRPSCYFVKPQRTEDLLRYYNMYFLDPKFRSSLINQSAQALKMQKITNKNSIGNFRYRVDLKEGEESLLNKDKVKFNLPIEDTNSRTVEKVIEDFKLMINFDLTVEDLCELWDGVLQNERVFRQVNLLTSSILPKNIVKDEPLVPVFPAFRPQNVVLLNPLPLLMMYYFDEGNFFKDGRKLKSPDVANRDIFTLFEVKPILILALEELSKEKPESYKNYSVHKAEIINDKHYAAKLKSRINRLKTINKPELADKLEKIFKIDNGLQQTVVERIKKDSDGKPDIASFLRNKTRVHSEMRTRVVMVPRTTSNTLESCVLGLKTMETCRQGYMQLYQYQEGTVTHIEGYMKNKSVRSQDLIKLSDKFANYFSVCIYVEESKLKIREAIDAFDYRGENVNSLASYFDKLPPVNKMRCIVPLIFHFPEHGDLFLRHMKIVEIVWTKEQKVESDEGVCIGMSPHCRVVAVVKSGKILSARVNLSDNAHIQELDWIMKRICNDLKLTSKRSFSNFGYLSKHVDRSLHRSNFESIIYCPKDNTFKVLQADKDVPQSHCRLVKFTLTTLSAMKEKWQFHQLDNGSVEVTTSIGAITLQHRDVQFVTMQGCTLTKKIILGGFDMENLIQHKLFTHLLNGSLDRVTTDDLFQCAADPNSLFKDLSGGYARAAFDAMIYPRSVNKYCEEVQRYSRALIIGDDFWSDKIKESVKANKPHMMPKVEVGDESTLYTQMVKTIEFEADEPIGSYPSQRKPSYRYIRKVVGKLSLQEMSRKCLPPFYDPEVLDFLKTMLSLTLLNRLNNTNPEPVTMSDWERANFYVILLFLTKDTFRQMDFNNLLAMVRTIQSLEKKMNNLYLKGKYELFCRTAYVVYSKTSADFSESTYESLTNDHLDRKTIASSDVIDDLGNLDSCLLNAETAVLDLGNLDDAIAASNIEMGDMSSDEDLAIDDD